MWVHHHLRLSWPAGEGTVSSGVHSQLAMGDSFSSQFGSGHSQYGRGPISEKNVIVIHWADYLHGFVLQALTEVGICCWLLIATGKGGRASVRGVGWRAAPSGDE